MTYAAKQGAGLAILVNANAKRGGRRVAAQMGQMLPRARIRLTRTEDELAAWLHTVAGANAILAAGGDGTVLGLVNAVAESDPAFTVPLGILPLGTGNGWAHAMGAPKLDRCLRALRDVRGPLPLRPYGLFRCEGVLAHFAGSGWDAMILNDYKKQVALSGGTHLTKSVWGYLSATLFQTAPRALLEGIPDVLVENLGETVFRVHAGGELEALSVEPGDVLYQGPVGGASVGTTPEFGYGFRAFPFAERLPGFFNVRVYTRTAIPSVISIPRLWRGDHPISGMNDWMATHIRMTFSRPVPVQVGGDALGERQSLEYRMHSAAVRMVDWRQLAS